jgi:hypothetical protein
MPDKTNITTDEHFEIFKDECRKWIDILGLKDWEVYFYHDESEDCLGWYSSSHVGRGVSIHLTKTWPDNYEPCDYEIRKVAFHEVVEGMLLGKLKSMANNSFAYDRVDEEAHTIVRTLENVLWDHPQYSPKDK